MAKTERLYERALKRPLDDATREAIEAEYNRRRREIPVATELHWHKTEPRFSLKSSMLSFHGHFDDRKLVVDAELSFAARMMVTDKHRQQAIRVIDDILEDLELA